MGRTRPNTPFTGFNVDPPGLTRAPISDARTFAFKMETREYGCAIVWIGIGVLAEYARFAAWFLMYSVYADAGIVGICLNDRL